MSELRLAPNLVLPAVETAVQRLAFIGTTGSGKTYAAMKTAEQMHLAERPFAALDVMGIWYGLRIPADDGSAGLGSVFVFGGRHGDVALTEDDGALVAETIHARNLSAVVDISELDTNAAKARFAAAFAKRIYEVHKANPRALHLFLEEAHEYLPQNPERGDAVMLGHWNRLWKQGRNFGLGGSLISQRPQDLNKKALELTALVLAFNTVGSNAVAAMRTWMGSAETLGIEKLQPGQCIAWSPSWLKIGELVQVERRETAHVSFDPLNPGASPEMPDVLPLPREAMAEIRETFEREGVEKTDDLERLRGEVARWKTEAERWRVAAQTPGAYSEGDLRKAVLSAEREMALRVDAMRSALLDVRDVLDRTLAPDEIRPKERSELRPPDVALPLPTSLPSKFDSVPADRPSLAPPTSAPHDVQVEREREGKGGFAQDVLDTVAMFEGLGQRNPRQEWVGACLGKSSTSGYWRGTVKGLVERRDALASSGLIALTDAGRAKAKARKPLALSEIHDLWAQKAQGLAGDILRLVIEKRTGLGTGVIGERLDKSSTSGYFRTAVKRLRTMGLVTVENGLLVPTPLLFPEGLS